MDDSVAENKDEKKSVAPVTQEIPLAITAVTDDKKVAYAPDQPAPPPRVRTLDSEEEKQEIEVSSDEDTFNSRDYLGPIRVRGPDWDGNSEDDYSFLAHDNNGNNDDTPNEPSQEYLVEAEAVQEPVLVTAQPETFFRRNQWWIVGGGIVIFIAIVAVIVSVAVTKSDGSPTEAPTTYEDGVEEQIRALLFDNVPQGEALHKEALDWVVEERMRITRGGTSHSNEQLLSQYALLTLYLSATSEGMEFVTENFIKGTNNECDWHGVTCDESGSVISLDLPKESLSGTIPPTIGLLSNRLSHIDLSENFLIGSLPPETFYLTNLSVLDLSRNSFSGGIPNSIGKATNLAELKLSDNKFSSSLPAEIGGATSLKTIEVANNEVGGSIPSEIGNLETLEELDLSNNALSYELSTEIGNLVSLKGLHLQHNRLLGPLPSEMGLMVNLRNW
eukprot:CAMPEP_0178912426 /NCGR_PEP_ID=MMETSP0786-20121207/10258_1 /TAXON_ID=186022 /ORGANISM="Thalassionema frauenfeldii, Strain CCMP 1798" /LENGTH=444 /DNA_ID=CAMNT_0020585011 /DNA_START=27 /DNA_END=1358 /DNA_ORIENTATION=+